VDVVVALTILSTTGFYSLSIDQRHKDLPIMCWTEARFIQYTICGHTDFPAPPYTMRCDRASVHSRSEDPFCKPLEPGTRTLPGGRTSDTPCWQCMRSKEWMRFVLAKEWHHKDSQLCKDMVASGRVIAPLPPNPHAPIAPPQPPQRPLRRQRPQPPTTTTTTYGGPARPGCANTLATQPAQQGRQLQPHEPAYIPTVAETLRAAARLRQAVTSAIHIQLGAVTSAIHTQSEPAETREIVASVQTLAQRETLRGLENEFCHHLRSQSSGALPPNAQQQFELWSRMDRVRLQSRTVQLVQVMTQAATTSLLRAIRQAEQ